MNTKNLKAYAPKARTQFIEAVKKRAALFGIYEDRIEEVRIEGGAAIIEGRAFTRKEGEQRKRLESKVVERGYDMFIREMAYTWFNRLAALRYMEIHDYFDHGFRVLSHPTNPDSLPEVLSHASDVADSLDLDKSQIVELQLAGDKEEELYRELLLGQCHHLYKIMPFMFEAIDDATELLLPNNLTKTDSILKGFINDIPEEDWQEIEVIGWLYQFYISEHKDAVIGKVVKSEDIPAATQLFTPNWIVKYLVQNSMGRQWLATYPDSELKGKMDYYIEPAEQSEEVVEQLKAITPTSIDPEEIKVLDPACGSGHILVEVYEVLREIYLERGYRLREIPELILTKNIYGLDIDDRAAQLAGFALMMKAREDDRRIFQRVEGGEVSLNVFSLQSTEHLDIPKLWKALDLEGNQQTGSTGGLFDSTNEFIKPTGVYKEYYELLLKLKSKFLQAKTLGSLIQIEFQYLHHLVALSEELKRKYLGADPAAKQASAELTPIINQALVLTDKFNAVIANPPYMGGKAMNKELKDFLIDELPEGKSDLMTAFIARESKHLTESGMYASVTLDSWLFLSSYVDLRNKLFENGVLDNILHIGWNCFPQGHLYNRGVVKIYQNGFLENYKTRLMDLSNVPATIDKEKLFLERKLTFESVYESNLTKFSQIPDFPFAFSLDNSLLDAYRKGTKISSLGKVVKGLDTCDNERFTRLWYEVSDTNIGFETKSIDDTSLMPTKWYPYCKGGSYRKWYGNYEYIVNWKNDGEELRNFRDEKTGKLKSRPQSTQHYFKTGLTFGAVTSSDFSCRFMEESIFGGGGNAIFVNDPLYLIGFLNSDVFRKFTDALNPTINMLVGDILKVPLITDSNRYKEVLKNVNKLIELQKKTWNSSELSWGFSKPEFIEGDEHKIYASMENYQVSRSNTLKELYDLEKHNNYLFEAIYNVEAYSKEEKFSTPKFKIPTIELLSYATGCMVGRYSLDKEGLVYAQSGNEGFKELETEGVYKSFPADDDGIIPLASEEWLFDDDATTRFKEFVKTVWGDEHLTENLEFVAESLCLHALKPKKGESAMDTIRRYFSTQFFKDHCKTYKKRPIYWLFSSGKEKAFECLVYLHRYNEGTLSRMRTEYVTPLMGKYEAQHTLLSEQQLQATGTEARTIEKDLKSLEKKQAELRTFDEQLKHYAEMRITLDLDDGVKANYGKFGNLLADVKAIHGKAVK